MHEAAAQLVGSLARYAAIGVSMFLARGTAPAVSGYLGCAMAGLFCALDDSVAVLIPGFGWVEGVSVGGKCTVQLRWPPH